MTRLLKNSTLTIVIPCYNEEEVLGLLASRLIAALDPLALTWDVVFIDDGSRDRTREILTALHDDDPRFKVIGLSRNFGHQSAIAAGLAHAQGDIVAIMDADLQDPPEILEPCLQHWRSGYDVVYAIRQKRKESLAKRLAYAGFYRMLKQVADVDIPLDSGDFCLMDRRVVDVLNAMPERNIFLRGLRAWSGFRQIGLAYERDSRAAGQTKYPFRRLVRLALDGIFSFSTLPLRLSSMLGLATLCLCMAGSVFIFLWRVLNFRFMGHVAAELPGWSAAAIIILSVNGVQMLMLGLMGEYLARVYDEVKGRPRWITNLTLGFTPPTERRVGPSAEREAVA